MIKIEYLNNQLIKNCKEILSHYWKDVEVEFNSSATKLYINFIMNKENALTLKASFHPMDTPWRLASEIMLNKVNVGDIENIIYLKIEEESEYELYPFLLNSEEKINSLVRKFTTDLRSVLEKNGRQKIIKSRFLLDDEIL